MDADLAWQREMTHQAEHLTAIMRSVDDEGIGARAHLDVRIERLFHLFSCGENWAAEKMLRALGGAKSVLLNDEARNFVGARGDMNEWHGDAANNFRQYLNDLDDGVNNVMMDRLATLIMILRAYQALVLKMREDVNKLVKHALDGIAAAKTNGWQVGAAIVGAVFTIASAAAGAAAGGPPLAVLGMIAGSMAGGAVGVAIEAKGAASELGVVVEFVNSGEGMIHLIDVERAKIEQAFRELAISITDANLAEVRPARPYIVTAPDFRPEAFGLSDQEQGRHRKPTDTRDLVPEPNKRPGGPYDQTTTPDGKPHDRYEEQGPA